MLTDNDKTEGGKYSGSEPVLPPLFAIIMAGGSGLRAGGGLPKQFHILGDKPVFMHSIGTFLKVSPDTHIVIVTHSDYIDLVKKSVEDLKADVTIVTGGSTRWESVQNGLKAISETIGLVAVHDAARPLVTPEMIAEGWATAMKYDAAVPCVPVTDSLRIKSGDATTSVDRSLFMAVQTPQIFNLHLLKEVYQLAYQSTFTDDASVVEAAGHEVAIFAGSPRNLKITTPFDFVTARALIDG